MDWLAIAAYPSQQTACSPLRDGERHEDHAATGRSSRFLGPEPKKDKRPGEAQCDYARKCTQLPPNARQCTRMRFFWCGVDVALT